MIFGLSFVTSVVCKYEETTSTILFFFGVNDSSVKSGAWQNLVLGGSLEATLNSAGISRLFFLLCQ